MLGDRVVRLWRLYQTPQGKKMFRYTMASVISTIVSFGTLGVVYGLAPVGSEVPDTVLANIAGIFPSYYLNRYWAWGKSGKSHLWREVVPFWAMSLAGMVLSIFAAGEARDLGISLHLHHFGRTLLLMGANVLAFGVLWVLKFILFNRLFHVAPALDETELADATQS